MLRTDQPVSNNLAFSFSSFSLKPSTVMWCHTSLVIVAITRLDCVAHTPVCTHYDRRAEWGDVLRQTTCSQTPRHEGGSLDSSICAQRQSLSYYCCRLLPLHLCLRLTCLDKYPTEGMFVRPCCRINSHFMYYILYKFYFLKWYIQMEMKTHCWFCC